VPQALPNLYCLPNDVYEFLGIDAVQLREDDRNQASGQTVATTSDSPPLNTTIAVSALQYAMLAGTNLVFENAGLAQPVTAVMTAAAAANATSLTVAALATDIPSGATATDNGVNVWLAGMLLKSCKYGTATVKRYCVNRYQDSDLANSWSVNDWATTVSARWIGMRRFNPVPSHVETKFQETMEELRRVNSGQLMIEDIGARSPGWPFMDNLTMVDWLTYTKVRVEQITSDPSPTQGPQFCDWNSVLSLEGLW
jgi:hypothetical protein